jgi:hypothetical protein
MMRCDRHRKTKKVVDPCDPGRRHRCALPLAHRSERLGAKVSTSAMERISFSNKSAALRTRIPIRQKCLAAGALHVPLFNAIVYLNKRIHIFTDNM